MYLINFDRHFYEREKLLFTIENEMMKLIMVQFF